MACLLHSLLMVSFISFAHALPLAVLSTAESIPLAIPLSVLPVVILAVCKSIYLIHRKAQSIHSVNPVSAANANTSATSVSLPRFRMDTGYFVGFLGSPAWEIKIQCRVDKVTRKEKVRQSTDYKPSSSILYGRILGDSSGSSGSHTSYYTSRYNHSCSDSRSRSRSRSVSASYLDMRSPQIGMDSIMNCSNVHPSSPACTTACALPAMPVPAHIPSSFLPSSPELHSPTLMQIMEPVLSSWYDDAGSRHEKDTSQDISLSSKSSSNRSRSARQSQSPTPPFETPLTSPQLHGTTSPSLGVNILRQQLGLSSSSPRLKADGIESVTFSVYNTPSVSVPEPVYTPRLRPRSCDVLTGDWQSASDILLSQSPTHRSSLTQPNMMGLTDSSEVVPFAPTTRPLNVSAKLQASPPLLGASISQRSLTPLEIATGKIRKPSKTTLAQRRKSGSPPIGPSPLRNSVLITSTSLPKSVTIESLGPPVSTSGNTTWELEDLVKDGQLDIDAVSALLGLGLSVPPESPGDSNPDLHREPEPASELEIARLKKSGMGWGRACETGTTTLVQLYVPGEQLTSIPKESDSILSSVRNSMMSLRKSRSGVASELSHALSSLLAEVGMADLASMYDLNDADRVSIWEDEQSWRDSVSYRDSIGLAC